MGGKLVNAYSLKSGRLCLFIGGSRHRCCRWISHPMAPRWWRWISCIPSRCFGDRITSWRSMLVIYPAAGGQIKPDTHRNTQIRVVFIPCMEDGNTTAELEFQEPKTYFMHTMSIPYPAAAISGGVFAPSRHMLLICVVALRLTRERAAAGLCPVSSP